MFGVINIPQYIIMIIIKHGNIIIPMPIPNQCREYGAALIGYLEFSTKGSDNEVFCKRGSKKNQIVLMLFFSVKQLPHCN